MLLFRLYHLTKVINNVSVKQGEVSTFPVGTWRTHTNTTHSREHYIQRMSLRRKSNVMHLPSLQPPDLLIPVTTHHQTSAYYKHVLREQSVILTMARGTCAESCTRPLREESGRDTKQCFPPGWALRHPRRSDVTAALLNSWSVPSEPIVGTLRPCDRLCRSRLEMSFLVVISATAVAAWLPRWKGELEQ